MPTEQQPEEAATKLPAAAASAAGSYVQTQMYGRAFRQRPDSTARAKDAPATDGQTPSSGRPAARQRSQSAMPKRPGEAPGTSTAEDAPDWPDMEELLYYVNEGREEGVPTGLDQGLPGEAPADMGTPEPGLAEPEVSAEVFVACSEQDAAAARARLVQGQQLELPPVVPPVPGMAPGL